MVFDAPTFIDKTGVFYDRNIDSLFYTLVESFGIIRKKLGDDRYATMIELAGRAKALFAADQDDTNGKTRAGRELLMDIQDLLNEVRKRRVQARLPDDEGEVTGD